MMCPISFIIGREVCEDLVSNMSEGNKVVMKQSISCRFHLAETSKPKI